MQAQRFGCLPLARVVGHQPLSALALLAGHDHRLAHRRMGRQRRLYLPQLDAEAPHLHLEVVAPKEFDLAPRQPPAQVPRLVHPLPGPLAEGDGQEALGRQRGTVQITARDSRAPDIYLADDAHRRGLQLLVQNINLRVRDRAPDVWREVLASPHPDPGGISGGLRRAVQVTNGLRLRRREDPLHQLAPERLARQIYRPHRSGDSARLHQRLHHGRHGVDQCRLQRRETRIERVVHDHDAGPD